MKGEACTLRYGCTAIAYELVRSARRTMEIAVHPDKRVVVRAPAAYGMADIEARVRKRAGWIARQLAYFEQYEPRRPPRQYVGGESHLFLGRQYRLKLHPANQNAVAQRDGYQRDPVKRPAERQKERLALQGGHLNIAARHSAERQEERVVLQDGYLHVQCRSSEPARIKRLLELWYAQQARALMPQLLEDCWRAFGGEGRYPRPRLRLRVMRTRWGSMSAKTGRLTLNAILIQAPKECIEYVIFHELCHLAHHNHGPKFYALQDRVLPDWRTRKKKLEQALA